MERVISVNFKSDYGRGRSKAYHYRVLDNYSYNDGDHVVVKVNGELKIAKVIEEVEQGKAFRTKLKPIVCKVHRGTYDRFQEKARRIHNINTRIKEIEKDVEAEFKLKMLEQHSPEAAELLKELKGLE